MITSMAKPTPYRHDSLSDAASQIRLLKLTSCEDDFSAISGELVAVGLAEAPDYVALSYVWGPETPLMQILLHGKPFNVQQNLYSFLWHFLRAGRNEMLWIDALCINQEDLTEKSSAVNSMGDLYRQAASVVIWLGSPDEIISEALSFLGSYVDDASTAQNDYFRDHKVTRYFDAIRRLVDDPYWSRIWIVQEFILARHIYVLYGTSWHGWDHFFSWLSSEDRRSRPDEIRGNQSKVSELSQQRDRHQAPSGPTGAMLIDLVTANRERNCKDSRDRVFGLLSLVDRPLPGSRAITANYQMSTAKLFFTIFEARDL